MRIRHRIPSIFSLSMVDVLCCALGCVILLWLLNFREAKRRAVAADMTAERLLDAEARLVAAENHLTDLARERDTVAGRAALAMRERDKVRGDLASARARVADFEDRLAKKLEDVQLLTRERAAAQKDIDGLQSLLRERETQAKAAARGADDLAERLRVADVSTKKLRDEVDALRGSQARLATMEKDLARARLAIDELQGEKKVLADQAMRARQAIENRFAGIALTGRRVVFLVDMSGSMELVDEKTAAPDKWTGVRETLTKIAKSLPELRKFQVILFAKETSYLMGNEGKWIDFDGAASVERIDKTLAGVKPKGPTNMYAAFETAFRFRADGLDTIYVLSDGLPNVGTGLTPEAALKMTEMQRSEILGAHVRKTLKATWNRPAVDDLSRVRINTVGFFYESPDVGAFLWALARENEGSFVGMSKP